MRRTAERHEAWTRDLPQSPVELWAYVVGLDRDSLMALLAHCVAQSVNGVRGGERRQGAWTHADDLAAHLKLDMTSTWTATAGTFRTDAHGHAYVILTTALRKGEYNAIRIVRRGHSADGRLVKRDVLAAQLS